jgi:membrane-associated phospholipid phosphatase
MPGLALMPIRNWPNAIPSLHVATAFIFVLYASEKLALKLVAWTFLLATALSTLVIGEHYLIDLVVAIPFAVFSVCIAERRIPRATGNFLMVIEWLLAIRFDTAILISHAVVLRICVLGTVAASLYSAFVDRDTAEFQPSAPGPGKGVATS